MSQRFSQNGWPAYATTEHFTRFTAADQGWWAANDDVAVVFAEFIERFDVEVEELTQPTLDDWSYANRLVRGSTSVVSNHGSATAIDLNALKHPRGVHDTFSPAKQRAMHRIRDDITDDAGRPVLRLGMDYTGTVDDMHVEINASAARVEQAANKIRARKESSMDLEDKVAYTKAARARLEKAEDPLRVVVQWPPAVRIARDEVQVFRREMTAQIGALTSMVAALAGAIQGGGSLTEAQATAAAEAGARAALAQLGEALDPDDPA